MLVPTPRLLFLAALGAIPTVLSGSHTAAVTVAALWLAGIVLCALVDGQMAIRGGDMTWQREHESKLSLGAWNQITLQAVNDGNRPLTFQVRDAAPKWMLSRNDSAAGVCPPRSAWSLAYQLFPLHRGHFPFGPVTARYLGPLGLVWKQRAYPLDDTVKVYPNLQAVRSYEALVRRGYLAEIGLRSSRQWGEGTEFDRLRDYTPDDEYRRVSWKATARIGTPVVVDYRPERSQNVIIGLDTGRLMSTRIPLPPALIGDPTSTDTPTVPAALSRLDYSVNAALLLAYVSQEYGDRVGLIAFSDRVSRYVSARPGRHQFLVITESLYDLEPEATATDYIAPIAHLGARNPRRSLIVLFTDLAETQSATQLITHISHLVPRHLPLVVALRDPSIVRLAEMPADTPRHVYERAVARRLLDERDQVLRRLRERGVLTLDVTADRLSPSVINRYLEVKAKSIL